MYILIFTPLDQYDLKAKNNVLYVGDPCFLRLSLKDDHDMRVPSIQFILINIVTVMPLLNSLALPEITSALPM